MAGRRLHTARNHYKRRRGDRRAGVEVDVSMADGSVGTSTIVWVGVRVDAVDVGACAVRVPLQVRQDVHLGRRRLCPRVTI